MGKCIVVCDMGNTATKLGVALDGVLKSTWSLPTRSDETPDSLGLQLRGLWEASSPGGNAPSAMIAVSVVPSLDSVLKEATEKYLGCPCHMVPEQIPVPLQNNYHRTWEVGADRLVGAWAARKLFPAAPSLIVVDFGTAVTFDCVEGETYLGGLIFPGPLAASETLSRKAAKLPQLDLADPGVFMPGRDTATSMRTGLLYGYAAVAEGLCQKLAATLSGPATIIATGGFAGTLQRICKIFAGIYPNLLLAGLVALHARSKQ